MGVVRAGGGEPTVVGQFVVSEPGRYELLVDLAGQSFSLRRVSDDAGVTHSCTVCRCCGACGCERGGLCFGCFEFADWARGAESRVAAYRAAQHGGQLMFTETRARVHAVGCPSIETTVRQAERALDAGCQHEAAYEPLVPDLLPAGRVHARRRRCRTCCPDVVGR